LKKEGGLSAKETQLLTAFAAEILKVAAVSSELLRSRR
jgi:hypothetical protein